MFDMSGSVPAPPVGFTPDPLAYGVIQMDPVAMVAHLNDSQARISALAMKPKSYLAFLDIVGSSFPSCLLSSNRGISSMMTVHTGTRPTISKQAVVLVWYLSHCPLHS